MKYLLILLFSVTAFAAEPVKISSAKPVVKYYPEKDLLELLDGGTWEDAAYGILSIAKNCDAQLAALRQQPKKEEKKK